MPLAAGELDRKVRIERPVADNSLDGAGSGTWELVKIVSASVRDMLPSRGERLAEGLNIASRPARVRIRYRKGVTPDMRFALLKKQGNAWVVERVMQIVAGPAELGRREAMEFMVEEYRPAGNAA